MFSIGGSTGIILSTNVMNIALHDSYYVVSHFHMVLSLGAINALFSGISTLQDHLLTTSISRYACPPRLEPQITLFSLSVCHVI